MKILVTLIFIVACTEGFLWGGDDVFPPWNKLSATFKKFSSLPMTEQDAIDDGWILSFDGCKNSSSFFYGRRYVKNNDISAMLLFDVNGKVAGIQFAFSGKASPQKNQIGTTILRDGKNFHITAYFTQPEAICCGKYRMEDYVGDKLFFSTGHRQFMEIPLKESLVKKTEKWVEGKCFYGMGKHYWYDISQNMDCEDFFPFFIMYNDGYLNGFGFATNAQIKSSRVEHPPKNFLYLFMEPKTLPKCLVTAKYLSTQHVYLERYPFLNFC